MADDELRDALDRARALGALHMLLWLLWLDSQRKKG